MLVSGFANKVFDWVCGSTLLSRRNELPLHAIDRNFHDFFSYINDIPDFVNFTRLLAQGSQFYTPGDVTCKSGVKHLPSTV